MKIITFFLIFFLYSNNAYAYIDPGLIAGLFNMLVASVSAFFFFFVFRPINFIKSLFIKKNDDDKNDDDTAKENIVKKEKDKEV
tara:strand:- start:736 stop:987 length:252 start_codon:yes stop_codon:yes gene_type:complete